MADIPKIRFKGFTEPWEQRKVSETAEIVAGGTPSTSVSEYWEPKEVPWLSSGEVHKKYVTYTDDMISKLGLSNSSAKMIKENSILIALAGQGKTRGTVAINRISLSTNQSIAAMTFNDDIIPEFVFSNLENRYDEIRAMSSGDGSRGGLNKQLVGNIVIPYTIIEEQRKIGAYFENLDNLITLHQRKCDDTKKLKKYMLQKMFPKNGEKFPEIRFKGFTEAWEQRKLGEVLKERTERAKGDEELLSVTIANGVIRQIDSEKRNTASEDRSNYKIVKKGDVPYNSMRMWQGAVGNSKYNGIVSPAYTILTPTSEANGKFFMELFKKKSTLQIFQRWSQGLTSDTWNLKYPILSSIQFAIPSVEEQEKIAEYFSSLDYLITLHQRKYFIIYNKLITWEQRKLGDIITEYKETVDSDCTLPILTSSKTEGVILQEEHFGRKQQHDITGYNILPRNYCTYRNRSDGVDFTFNINKCCDKGIISKFYPVFSGKNSDVFFLSLVLNNSEEVVREIAYTCTGTGQKVLSFLDLQKMKVRVPNFDEQKEIAAYFESLDHLITLHRRAL